MKLIIAIIILSGCGTADKLLDDVQEQDQNPHRYSMEDHNPIFNQYAAGFPSNTKQIPIVFVDTLEGKAGVCYSWTSGHREIEINKETWDAYSDKRRRWLIWHELGHCELGKRHVNLHINNDDEMCDDNTEEYKCGGYTPLSVMRWYIPYDLQVDAMCGRKETDELSRLFCDSVGLYDKFKILLRGIYD